MHRFLKSRARGLGWAIIAIFIWSGSLVMLRLGVTATLNAYDLTALRFSVAATILLPVIVKHGFALRSLGTSGIAILIIGFGAPYILLVCYGLTLAPASAAGSLNPGLMAVFTVLAGWQLFQDELNSGRILGIVAILAGVTLYVGIPAAGQAFIGYLIFAITALMWAGYVLTVRRSAIPALQATAIVAVGSAAIYLPLYALALPKNLMEAPILDILVQSVFQGILVSVIAVFAFNRSAEHLGPIVGATLPALIPLTTLGLGYFLLGEQAAPRQLVAAIAIGGGVVLTLARPESMLRYYQGLVGSLNRCDSFRKSKK